MRPEIGGIPATAALVFWILLVLASADQLFATHRFMCDSCPSRKLPIAHSKTLHGAASSDSGSRSCGCFS
jgi:hypothetical protein